MRMQRKDNDNYFGLTIFIVLFFLFIGAFSDHATSQAGRTLHYKTVSDLHSQVTDINDARQIRVQKNAVRFIEKTNFNLSGDGHKLMADNKSIYHSIIFLQKTGLLIRPLIHQRYYCLCHAGDTDDLPGLS